MGTFFLVYQKQVTPSTEKIRCSSNLCYGLELQNTPRIKIAYSFEQDDSITSLFDPADLSRAEAKVRKIEGALSVSLVRAKDAEKRLRKETSERELVSTELKKVLRDGCGSGSV